MKLRFLLALTLISITARAQYTETTFRQAMERYTADPLAFLKNETTSDFRFISGDSKLYGLHEVIAIYDHNIEGPRAFEDLKIISDNNTALATGKLLHVLITRAGGDTLKAPVYFNYSLIKTSGGWKLAHAQHTDIFSPFDQDRKALIAMIEAETDAYLKADFAQNRTYHSKKPYGSYIYPGGNFFGEVYTKAVSEYWKTLKPANDTVERTNWNFRVNRQSAYVTFTSTIRYPDREDFVTHESRYLERENGEWKIVGVAVVLPKK